MVIVVVQVSVMVVGKVVRFGEGMVFQVKDQIVIDVKDWFMNVMVLNYDNFDFLVCNSFINVMIGQFVQNNVLLSLCDGLINVGMIYGCFSISIKVDLLQNVELGVIYGLEVIVDVFGCFENFGQIFLDCILKIVVGDILNCNII